MKQRSYYNRGINMKKNCIVYVLWDTHLQKQLHRIKSTNSREKQIIIDFWLQMIDNGYQHFYVHVDSKIELWVIEILYFLRNIHPLSISYTLILNSSNKDWICYEYHWNDIVSSAKNIVYWQNAWYPLNYTVEVLDLYI